MQTLKILLSIFILVVCSAAIVLVFWQQEIQYVQPAPVPENYEAVGRGQQVRLEKLAALPARKHIFLHFFNPECPCSRFNVPHFLQLHRQYGQQIDFQVIIPAFADAGAARQLLGEEIPVFVDRESRFAQACGVYATPQAIIIDGTGKLYYRGNYNRARYCTTPATSYARLALQNYLQGNPPPYLGLLAEEARGCSFLHPEEKGIALFFSSLIN